MKYSLILLAFFFSSCAVAQDYKIPINPNAKFYSGDTVFFQVNDVNSSGLVNELFDEQDADPDNNIQPKTTFTSGYSTRPYYPATAVIDLGGYYQINHEYFYRYLGTDSLYIQYGEPFNWNKDTLKSYAGGQGWKDYGRQIKTRYLKIFYANRGYQKVRELVLYGHLIGDSLPRENKHPYPLPTKTLFTMGQFIGFNQIGPREVDSVGALKRHYTQYDWLDTDVSTHNIDSLIFQFSKFGTRRDNTSTTGSMVNYFFPGGVDTKMKSGLGGPTNYDLHQGYLNNTGYFDAIQGVPVYAKGQGKPIDKVIHPSYDATDPNSYDRVARMMWNYAAYNGGVKYPASVMQTNYPELSGMQLERFVEAGNEMNQDWSGRDKHFTPWEFIAYSSAFYDGNNDRMGPRMGVKNADPNMIVIQAGTAGASIDYLRAMKYYAYYIRKDHSAPFDILNFHAYATNGKNGTGTTPHAMSPEDYFGNSNNPVTSYIKAANELFPGKPIWLTEWGYDRNGKSPNSVPPIPGKDSAQVQADWIARFWIMLSFTGIERSTIFQLRNDPLKSLYDTLGTNKFNTTGLTDGHYVGNQYSPSPKIFATNWFAFPAYYYQRTLWLQLYNYSPDTIVYKNFDSLYVYKYRFNDSAAYVIWSGTQTNRKVSKAFNTGHINTPVRIVQLADKHFTGITTNTTTDANGNINLSVSETPLIVFAKDGKDGGKISDINVSEPPVDQEPLPKPTIKSVIIQYSDGTTEKIN